MSTKLEKAQGEMIALLMVQHEQAMRLFKQAADAKVLVGYKAAVRLYEKRSVYVMSMIDDLMDEIASQNGGDNEQNTTPGEAPARLLP